MKRLSHYRTAGLGTTLLIAAFVLCRPAPSYGRGPPSKDVVVVNTPAQPVPVAAQGTTVISGNVGIDPSRNTVRIGNSADDPALVRNVDEGSRQPFHRELSVSQPPGTAFGEDSLTVPANKRFVIEYASMRGNLPAGQTVFVNILTRLSAGDAFHTLVLSDQGMFGVIHMIGAAQQMRIYADPNSTVTVSIGRDPSAGAPGQADFFLTLSGYLVDVP